MNMNIQVHVKNYSMYIKFYVNIFCVWIFNLYVTLNVFL